MSNSKQQKFWRSARWHEVDIKSGAPGLWYGGYEEVPTTSQLAICTIAPYRRLSTYEVPCLLRISMELEAGDCIDCRQRWYGSPQVFKVSLACHEKG